MWQSSYVVSNAVLLDVFADSSQQLFCLNGTLHPAEENLHTLFSFCNFICLFTYWLRWLTLLQDVVGVGPRATVSKVTSAGDGDTGNAILDLSEQIVVAMTPPTENQTTREVRSATVGALNSNIDLLHSNFIVKMNQTDYFFIIILCSPRTAPSGHWSRE